MTQTDSTPAPATTDGSYDEADAILTQLVRFIRMMKRATTRYNAQTQDGLEQAAYYLLAVLVTEGPQRTTSLAEAVHSDTSTVSRQAGALVRHGLVERQADPADGRACLLAATPEGERCFHQDRRARTEQIARTLRQWTPADLRTTATLLERLNTDFERFEAAQNNGAIGTAHLKGGTE
jgi:DNA-binding MarR family transcriptional regulator